MFKNAKCFNLTDDESESESSESCFPLGNEAFDREGAECRLGFARFRVYLM